MLPPCYHRRQPEPQHQEHEAPAAAGASSNPYLVDHLKFMREQEDTAYRIPPAAHYLAPPYAAVTPAERRTMLAWSFEIVRACSIPREIAVVGAQCFDRFLATAADPSSPRARAALSSRRDFQLAFIACLVLALKCRAGMQVDSEFVSGTICQALYDEEELLGMEREVLRALRWRLNGPTPHEFVAGMVELLPPGVDGALAETLTKLAHAKAEDAMLDYATALERPPSSIAYAALMSAMKSIGADAFRALDRLAWMRNIDTVVPQGGQRRDSPNSGNSPRMAAAPISACPTPMQRATSWPPKSGFHYCSPVSSEGPVESCERTEEMQEEHHPYLDVLSIAGSKATSNYLSPVCAMLDEIQYGN